MTAFGGGLKHTQLKVHVRPPPTRFLGMTLVGMASSEEEAVPPGTLHVPAPRKGGRSRAAS